MDKSPPETTVRVVPLGLTLSSFLLVTYTLCIVFGLLASWSRFIACSTDNTALRYPGAHHEKPGRMQNASWGATGIPSTAQFVLVSRLASSIRTSLCIRRTRSSRPAGTVIRANNDAVINSGLLKFSRSS